MLKLIVFVLLFLNIAYITIAYLKKKDDMIFNMNFNQFSEATRNRAWTYWYIYIIKVNIGLGFLFASILYHEWVYSVLTFICAIIALYAFYKMNQLKKKRR
ncbi:hypothetical protein BU586_02650 [Staphylococcus agnetis]|nr:hypothetical protein CD172_02185 [Staphylococcus agnetis]PTH31392.1 hypothetical protein BU589_09975 [Staphylococcus agnetis]PTH70795.1 hypothetical protein BU586_02650 [Staphylococcus agnetis]PTH76362.1 hypothetical protein BU579_09520 [Staphylococcus agnetis]